MPLTSFVNFIKDLEARIAELEERLDNVPTPPPDEEEPETPQPPTVYKGIWTSRDEIMRRPMSGAAWDNLKAMALRNWAKPDLGDNNAQGDTECLAGAIYYARTGDETIKEKVIRQLQAMMNSRLTRTLELGRGLQGYVCAADIIGYRDPAFMKRVEELVDTNIPGHSGFTSLYKSAKFQWNNWSMHARSSLLCAGLYLGREDWVKTVLEAHKQLIGIRIDEPYNVNYAQTGWMAKVDKDGKPVTIAGVNVKGSYIMIGGKAINVSGVLHQDWLRGEINPTKWPAEETGYMWEGMQGFVSTAVILHRAGLLDISAGDNAVVRAMNALYGRGEAALNNPPYVNPAEGDDQFLPWLVNYYCNEDYPTTADTSPGKGLGYAQYLYS